MCLLIHQPYSNIPVFIRPAATLNASLKLTRYSTRCKPACAGSLAQTLGINMRPLERLIGIKLLNAEISVDGASFRFSNCVLTAFNPVLISTQLSEIVDSEVCAVSFQNGQCFELRFSNGSTISISLSPQDYSVPEAFCATFSDNIIVVE